MIVEMRTMRVKPGRRGDFLEIFQTRSMPAQAALGIKMLRPFLSVEDPDVFFFVRGFPDMASRDTMKDQFYEGPSGRASSRLCCCRCSTATMSSSSTIPTVRSSGNGRPRL